MRNSPGLRPSGVLDLGYGSFVDSVDPPPYPPGGASGPRMSTFKACFGALGRPFFDHFFTSILSSILDSFWIRFGVVLGSFWTSFGSPNRAKLGPKCVLSRLFFENVDFHETIVKPMRKPLFWPQDGPKIASRPIQDGSKNDKKVMHFSSWFLTRFGVVLGSFWDPFWEPKSTQKVYTFWRRTVLDRLDFDLVIGWSQDGRQDRSKSAPGGVLGRLGGVLGRSWELLGPLGRVLGGFWAVLRGSWAALGDSWALLEGSWRPVDIYCLCVFLLFLHFLLLWMFGVDFYDWCVLLMLLSVWNVDFILYWYCWFSLLIIHVAFDVVTLHACFSHWFGIVVFVEGTFVAHCYHCLLCWFHSSLYWWNPFFNRCSLLLVLSTVFIAQRPSESEHESSTRRNARSD